MGQERFFQRARPWLRSLGRLLSAVALTLFGLLLITFILGRIIPHDPVISILGDDVSPQAYAEMRTKLGLDRPLFIQFIQYLLRICQGDLGISLMSSRPVLEDLMVRIPATFELATLSTLLGAVIGIPAGVVAAANHNKAKDRLIRVLSLLGYSLPVFWLGLVALLAFYLKLEILPGPGRVSVFYEGLVPPVTGSLLIDSLIDGKTEVFWDALSHIVLPTTILGLISTAYICRMTRSFMLAQMKQEYVTTAIVKGASRRRVIWNHAFRNILVQVVTILALNYGLALEGAVLTEAVFDWPGIGSYTTAALFRADMNAVLGATIVIGLIFIGINLISDAVYRLLDPRAS